MEPDGQGQTIVGFQLYSSFDPLRPPMSAVLAFFLAADAHEAGAKLGARRKEK